MPNLRCCPRILFEELRKAIRTSQQLVLQPQFEPGATKHKPAPLLLDPSYQVYKYHPCSDQLDPKSKVKKNKMHPDVHVLQCGKRMSSLMYCTT